MVTAILGAYAGTRPAAKRDHRDSIAATWDLLSLPGHRGVMTGPTETPPRADSHAAVRIALACGFWAVLLAIMQTGPQWVQWTASFVAFATAFTLIVIGEVGWERTVASARRAGLVAPPADGTR